MKMKLFIVDSLWFIDDYFYRQNKQRRACTVIIYKL